jgi:hypothetical protein
MGINLFPEKDLLAFCGKRIQYEGLVAHWWSIVYSFSVARLVSFIVIRRRPALT